LEKCAPSKPSVQNRAGPQSASLVQVCPSLLLGTPLDDVTEAIGTADIADVRAEVDVADVAGEVGALAVAEGFGSWQPGARRTPAAARCSRMRRWMRDTEGSWRAGAYDRVLDRTAEAARRSTRRTPRRGSTVSTAGPRRGPPRSLQRRRGRALLEVQLGR
jgi:hypothetical protein